MGFATCLAVLVLNREAKADATLNPRLVINKTGVFRLRRQP